MCFCSFLVIGFFFCFNYSFFLASGYNEHSDVVALLLSCGGDQNIKSKAGLSAKQDARGKSIDVYEAFNTLVLFYYFLLFGNYVSYI